MYKEGDIFDGDEREIGEMLNYGVTYKGLGDFKSGDIYFLEKYSSPELNCSFSRLILMLKVFFPRLL